MTSGPITSWQIDGETMETMTDFIFWAPISLWTVTGRKALMKLDQHIKKQRHHFSDKGPSCESYGSSSSHV